jgi:hypothetical protein
MLLCLLVYKDQVRRQLVQNMLIIIKKKVGK